MTQTRITVDPNIRFGKPTVRGTRITVQEVLELIPRGFRSPRLSQNITLP
jgi:uncharacterized protein (DUF433 family)